MKILCLYLDEMLDEGYHYTKYDIMGDGHRIFIKESDKEAFLDAYAAEERRRAEEFLRISKEWGYDDTKKKPVWIGEECE